MISTIDFGTIIGTSDNYYAILKDGCALIESYNFTGPMWSYEEIERKSPKYFVKFIEKHQFKMALPKQKRLDFRIVKREIKEREKRSKEMRFSKTKTREKFKFQGRNS